MHQPPARPSSIPSNYHPTLAELELLARIGALEADNAELQGTIATLQTRNRALEEAVTAWSGATTKALAEQKQYFLQERRVGSEQMATMQKRFDAERAARKEAIQNAALRLIAEQAAKAAVIRELAAEKTARQKDAFRLNAEQASKIAVSRTLRQELASQKQTVASLLTALGIKNNDASGKAAAEAENPHLRSAIQTLQAEVTHLRAAAGAEVLSLKTELTRLKTATGAEISRLSAELARRSAGDGAAVVPAGIENIWRNAAAGSAGTPIRASASAP